MQRRHNGGGRSICIERQSTVTNLALTRIRHEVKFPDTKCLISLLKKSQSKVPSRYSTNLNNRMIKRKQARRPTIRRFIEGLLIGSVRSGDV